MAFIPVTPPGSTNNQCQTCNTTRDVVVTFTAANPAPTNGYIVKWKLASDNTYTTVFPNPTSSPVTIYNVSACQDINVSVQSACAPGFESQPATTTVTGLNVPLKCDCGYEGTVDNMNFYVYPYIPLDFTGVQNGSTITIGYNSVTRINKFYVYNVTDSSTTISSGWAGQANYPGPWGASNNTATTGTIQFTYNSAKIYQLRVEVGGADPNNQTNDAWSVSMGCTYVPPGPTYYYYTGILCGGSITESFRSTTANLDSANVIIKANCATCGNTVQCFDNISVGSPNTNDVIGTFANCFVCNGASAFVPITNYYNPCTFSATGGVVEGDVYFANGTVDVALGVQLYTSVGAAQTTISLISSANGEVFNVNANGVVTSSTNQFC
jgi:hypothetical protein